ncbi:MAG: biopolymer transporter ExbD [Proteobacteria bacterium]|nr:biopolymer transporter ExbD [Pseudomonadota bacterium]
MNFRSGRKSKKTNFIDFTPIVDTVFNLIIFFAVSLNFIGTPAIKLKLPQASMKESVREKSELRVFITRGETKDGYTTGVFRIDDRIISVGDLENLIHQRSLSNPDMVLIIQADESVSQGEVVRVMDIAKNAGIDKIAIATRPKEK